MDIKINIKFTLENEENEKSSKLLIRSLLNSIAEDLADESLPIFIALKDNNRIIGECVITN